MCFGFSRVEKGAVARRSLAQGNLRVAERRCNGCDVDKACLRDDAATQLHVERRHAAG